VRGAKLKLSVEQKFKAIACANDCWNESHGNLVDAESLFRKRHGGCESILLWVQLAAALIQIAYTIWKWRQENGTKALPEGNELLAIAEVQS
jgi:hypothetical protein